MARLALKSRSNYHGESAAGRQQKQASGHFLRIIGSSPFSFKWRAHHLKVVQEECSEALHILDRFHIVAKMYKALDEFAPRKPACARPLKASSRIGRCKLESARAFGRRCLE